MDTYRPLPVEMSHLILSTEARKLIEESVTLLERPVHDCKLAHEDWRRDPETGEALSSYSFVHECIEKHGGCPHLLRRVFNNIEKAFEGIALPDDFKKSLEKAHEQYTALEEIDIQIRAARTRMLGAISTIIPSKEIAEQQAKPVLAKNKRALADFEPSRQWLIAELQKLLPENTCNM